MASRLSWTSRRTASRRRTKIDKAEGFFVRCLKRMRIKEVTENVSLMDEEDAKVIVQFPASLQMKRNMLEEYKKSESYIPDMGKMGKSKSMNSITSFTDKCQRKTWTSLPKDAQERFLQCLAETDQNVLNPACQVLPTQYPNRKAPIFSFLQGHIGQYATRNNNLVKLRNVAKQQISKKQALSGNFACASLSLVWINFYH